MRPASDGKVVPWIDLGEMGSGTGGACGSTFFKHLAASGKTRASEEPWWWLSGSPDAGVARTSSKGWQPLAEVGTARGRHRHILVVVAPAGGHQGALVRRGMVCEPGLRSGIPWPHGQQRPGAQRALPERVPAGGRAANLHLHAESFGGAGGLVPRVRIQRLHDTRLFDVLERPGDDRIVLRSPKAFSRSSRRAAGYAAHCHRFHLSVQCRRWAARSDCQQPGDLFGSGLSCIFEKGA